MFLRTLLLAFLLNLVRSDGSGGLKIAKIMRADTTESEETGDACICVPHYQCLDGNLITNGRGLIMVRKKRSTCEDFSQVCCKVPTRKKGGKECGQHRPEGVDFIIGGHNNKHNSSSKAQSGEFPWMVALMLRRTREDVLVYQCGGALIHESVVITAAHCIRKTVDDSEIIVRAGEWDTQRKNEMFDHQDKKIIRTIIHPGFQKESLWNDFALLVVDKPFIFVANVGTVCLPSPGTVPLSRECYASGWGKDGFGTEGNYSEILKKVNLPIVPKDRCTKQLQKTLLGRYFKLHESFVCAGGIIGEDACEGDGGSPLVCPVEGKSGTYELTGLVAWGIGCGDGTPGVYAGVAYALPWIDRTMTELGYPL